MKKWIGAAAAGLVCCWTCGSAHAAQADDCVTTMVATGEGGSTHVVCLQPFDPERELEKQLKQLPEMNARVVEVFMSYPRDGHHGYWWPKAAVPFDGVTTDITFAKRVVMRGEPQGRTFCCGLTLEVFYRVLGKGQRAPDALTSDTADLLKQLWFCRKLFSPGPEDAMVALGVGEKVGRLEDIRPGDFVQIWRHNKSGHSVIFVGWALDLAGKRVGMHYWSTQPGTKGVSFNTELFGEQGGTIHLQRTSFARLKPPAQWKSKSAAQLLAEYPPEPPAAPADASTSSTAAAKAAKP